MKTKRETIVDKAEDYARERFRIYKDARWTDAVRAWLAGYQAAQRDARKARRK